MVNVLIFSKGALENGRGGEISYIELALGLKKYFNVSIMDTNVLLGKELLTEAVIQKKLNGVNKIGRIYFASFKILNRVFTIPYPWEIIRLYKKIKKYDIIYTSLGNIKINILLIFFGLINRRIRFIIRYNKPLSSENLLSLYNIKIIFSILLFSIFKRNFYHHTISKHAKKYLDNFYNPNNVIHIIHGVELDNFKKNAIEVKSQEILNFIYVGYLDDIHKGLDVLIKAIINLLEENDDLPVFFEFCGAGPLKQKIRELEHEYPKYVKYHGYVDNINIVKFYEKSDVFLFTSRREPFGRVLIEALAAGLLVICSKTTGSIEILKGKDFAFFLHELDFNLIKEKIIEIYNIWLKDPDKYMKLRELAKDYAFQNYSVSQEILMFKDLIDRIGKNNV
ncbi:MAG: glycosyltransferase family 4 protein [Candidatus Lokiarchaeota archaeon]|nr:glycosyltransferase family 4 protein [Candidatus Lokiarchaeota archaeon]